ncbi:MAG TPA: LacI family DNA-binding transcriptional regulator [Solirubrobacteraceae bacterium]|nr:LacI family DNA-binding transcriptional regulator [Solirubrobacteraceae bacterium]
MPDGGENSRGRGRITIRQVAELAGVSVATASRALNGRADVSDETRLAVQRVAKSHGYGASSRSRGRRPVADGAHWTGIVGVTMPYSAPTYFSSILAGVVEALSERDMRALVCPTGHQHKYEATLIEELVRGETNGAILVLPEESPEELRALKQQGFHFVVVDPLHELDEDIPVVSAANASGAHQATAHLLELGHRRIGAITGPSAGLATRRRLMGYHSALVGAGIMPDPVLEVEGDYLIAGGVAGGERLLELPDPPTAILAFNDSMAIGALSAARARDLQIPDDLSIVGFDDTVEAEIAYPPLTTVRQPLKELGRMAVDLLFRLTAEHWSEPLHVELATRLITRSSAAAPAAKSARR